MDLVSYDFVMVPMDREFCIYLFWSAVLAEAQVTTCPRVAGPLQCPCVVLAWLLLSPPFTGKHAPICMINHVVILFQHI